MTVWLTPNKENTYASIRGQYNKETKKTDPLNNHISVDELIWKLDGNTFSILTVCSTAPAGAMLSKAAQESFKFPAPVKVQFEVDKASVGQLCIMKVLQAKTEQDKRYTGFISIADDNAFAAAIATGNKGDGTPLSEIELSTFMGQFAGLMECSTTLLSDEIISTMLKQEYQSKGGYGVKAESTDERITARETKLKTYLGLKPEATFADMATELDALIVLKPNSLQLIKILLT